MRYVFLLFFFIISFYFVCAQPLTTQPATNAPDSSVAKIKVPVIIRYTHADTDEKGLLKYSVLDSALDEIQLVNPAIEYFYSSLGNIGSASDPQLFRLRTFPLTYFGNFTYDIYDWKPEDIRYYKTNKNFSELSYHQGGGHEQVVKITLAENILKNWNVGIDFRRLGSQGYLGNGKTFHSNFDFFTWYHTPKNNYQLFASAIWNITKNSVNGGVASDSLINANDFSNSEMLGVTTNLADASHRWKNYTFSLNHFLDLKNKKDSSSNAAKFRFRHDAMYERAFYSYSDITGAPFYQNNYFDSLTTDSMHYEQLKNKLSFTHFIESGNSLFKNINYQLAGGYQWFQYRLMTDSSLIHTVTDYGNAFAEARINTLSENQKFVITGGVFIASEGKQSPASYTYDASLQLPVKDLISIEIGAEQLSHLPSSLQKFYVSNHFFWGTNFSNVQATVLNGKIKIPKYYFEFGINYNFIKNYIFFNTASLPEQSGTSAHVLQAFVSKNFKFGKFRFNNIVWWQKTNDEKEIRLPEFLSHNSLFYESGLFNKKLFTQIGFDLHYTSGYYSDAYNPAISLFHLQDSLKTNNYPLVDCFINFRIKTASVFIKLQNVGDNLFAKNYYQVAHYPMPGRVFQIGIVWRFFD